MSLIRQEVLNLIPSGLAPISTTWANLNTLVTGNSLQAGMFYLITDPIDGGQILIQAISTNQLSPNGSWFKTNEFRAFGFFRLSGVAGSVDAVNVNGVNQLTGVIPFSTNAITTADNVAANINANGARVVNAVVCRGDTTLDQPYIVLERLVGGVNTDAITVTTTTMVADDIGNMSQGAASTNVVYDIEYVLSTTNILSRITSCYDPILNAKASIPLVNAQIFNAISGIDNSGSGLKSPGFFRRGHNITRQMDVNTLLRNGVFTNSIIGISIQGGIFGGANSLIRGITTFANMSFHGGQLAYQNCTTGSTFSNSNTFIGPNNQQFANQSFGNLSLSNIKLLGAVGFTTRVTHSTGTSTIDGTLCKGSATITLVLGRAVGFTPSITMGSGATLSLNYLSTAGSSVLQQLDIGDGAALIVNNNTTSNASFGISGVEIRNGSVLSFTQTGSTPGGIVNTKISGVSMTLSAPMISLQNSEFISNSTLNSFFSITSLNNIIYNLVFLNGRDMKTSFSVSALTGAANNGLNGSPIYLGNLPDNFWATSTVWEATGLTGVGASLQLGIETDDDDAMIPATVIATLNDRLQFNAPANTQSTAVDRRIVATPSGATITAGQIKGTVYGTIGL